jgi:hypothetical protein
MCLREMKIAFRCYVCAEPIAGDDFSLAAMNEDADRVLLVCPHCEERLDRGTFILRVVPLEMEQ